MEKAQAMKLAGGLAFKDGRRLEPRLRSAHARRYFSELAESWDLWYDLFYLNDPPGMSRSDYEAVTVKEAERLRAWVPPGSSFLDLGCGDGRLLRLLAPGRGLAHGADISPKALELARRKCRPLRNVRLHLVTGLELPWPDASLDAVFCHLMLSQMDVEPVLAYMREVRRMLKPGGRFIFDLPNLAGEANLAYLDDVGRTNWPGINRPRFWTEEMVRTLVPRCGLGIETLTTGPWLEVVAARS